MSAQYQCVKSSVGSVIKHEGLRNAIEKRVCQLSPLYERGSALFALWVTFCYEHNANLPLLKKSSYATGALVQVFNPFPSKRDDGTWKPPHKDIHRQVLDMFVDDIGWTSNLNSGDIPGYARDVKLIANQYATLVVNHVEGNTIRFIENTAMSFCKSNGLPDSRKCPLVQDLVRVIVNNDNQPQYSYALESPELEEERDTFIEYHTNYLDNNDIDLQAPLGDQHNKIILYFVHMLKWQHTVDLGDDTQAPLIKAVPMYSIQRYSLTFDPEIMFYLLRDAGIQLPAKCNNEYRNNELRNLTAAYFVKERHYLNYLHFFGGSDKVNERRQPNSSNMGTTNGVKASRRFVIDPTIDPLGPDQERRKQYRHLKNTTNRKKQQVAVDPGRVDLGYASRHKPNGDLINSESLLTRKDYIRRSGIDKYTRKINLLLTPLQEANTRMSQDHIKHYQVEGVVRGLEVLLQYRDVRVEHKITHKKIERYNLHLFNQKRKVLSQAVNKLQDQSMPDVIILFGDANFPSGKKFERYVPVRAFKELVIRRLDSREVSEFRSSSVCIHCNAQLLTVAEYFNGRFYQVRGLKWCPSFECRSNAFKHRDGVGAVNIHRRHNNTQPPIMNRGSGEPWFNSNVCRNYHILCTQDQLPPSSLRRKNNRNKKNKKKNRR